MCYLRLKHSFVVEPGGREFPLLSPLQSLNSPSSQDACATFLILVNYLSLFDNFEWQHICENTFGWQYPYSVQHSAHPGHPSTWSSSSLGVLAVKIIANALWTKSSTTHNISFEEFEARWLDLNGAAAQDPVPVPAPRHPASMWGIIRGRSAWLWQWL